MSKRHPVVAVTGSSGAGTSTVKRAFEHIFKREGITPAVVEGDSYHRYERVPMKEAMAAALAKAKADHELIVVTGAPHTFDLHPKGTGWTRVARRWSPEGRELLTETKSERADLIEPTLAFLGRTIGK